MIKVVSFKICPFVQRVIAALESRNLAYDVEYISLNNPPEWFSKVSPNTQVHLLITDTGVTLFESDVIVEYLDDRYGPLDANILPEQRAIDRAWVYQASKHYLVQCGAMTSADEHTLNLRSDKLGKAFSRIEEIIGKTPFYRGQDIGNVDIAWLPLLHRANIIKERTGYDFISKYPNVKEWQSNLMSSGLAEKPVSEDFDEAFSRFYLSDKTYLGKGTDCSFDDVNSFDSGS